MGIAAYNRGSRAISAYIDQQLRDSRTIQPETFNQGFARCFKEGQRARLERETIQFRIDDNERRAANGLPTYEV